MRLTGTGQLLLVHTITDGGDVFFPCTYGYACTVRKAQGASLDMSCLHFDHCSTPARGYSYVAASMCDDPDLGRVEEVSPSGVFHHAPDRHRAAAAGAFDVCSRD